MKNISIISIAVFLAVLTAILIYVSTQDEIYKRLVECGGI